MVRCPKNFCAPLGLSLDPPLATVSGKNIHCTCLSSSSSDSDSMSSKSSSRRLRYVHVRQNRVISLSKYMYTYLYIQLHLTAWLGCVFWFTNVQPECVNLLFYYYYSGLPIHVKSFSTKVRCSDLQNNNCHTNREWSAWCADVPDFYSFMYFYFLENFHFFHCN